MKNFQMRQSVRFGSERGTALILAIVFMAILSYLGVLVIDVVNRENKMLSGYRAGGDFAEDRAGLLAEKKSFYLVDRVVEYSLNRRMLQLLNDLGDGGEIKIMYRDPVTNAITQDELDPGVTHFSLLTAEVDFAKPTLLDAKVKRLSAANVSFEQISRVAPGSSAKDLFIMYHLDAAACPANVRCDSYPEQTVRVDAQLLEVRPNPSGSSGSGEETDQTIWGSPAI